MREVPLSQGQTAFVDDEDYDRVSEHKWFALKKRNSWYAVANKKGGRKLGLFYMHRFIIGGEDKAPIDHADHNGLNNQKHNLRRCSVSQNGANVSKNRSDNVSGIRGVSWNSARQKWHVSCGNKYVGRFASKEEAALAYDKAAQANFGEFAYLNR